MGRSGFGKATMIDHTSHATAKTAFRLRAGCAALALAALAACGPAPVADGIRDPHETRNRAVHNFNKGVDRVALRPVSRVYGALPDPVERGVSNVAENLSAPGNVVNNLLQGRVGPAAQNTLRFATNTIFGIGGLFDTATALGLPAVETDFGETLHVWGVGEGNYVELPLLGPSTGRDAAGRVVDLATNPLLLALPASEGRVATGFRLASRIGDRSRYSDTLDSILYESADSYAQMRLLYLQNRRFELGRSEGAATGAAAQDAFVDPYEDPYGQ